MAEKHLVPTLIPAGPHFTVGIVNPVYPVGELRRMLDLIAADGDAGDVGDFLPQRLRPEPAAAKGLQEHGDRVVSPGVIPAVIAHQDQAVPPRHQKHLFALRISRQAGHTQPAGIAGIADEEQIAGMDGGIVHDLQTGSGHVVYGLL